MPKPVVTLLAGIGLALVALLLIDSPSTVSPGHSIATPPTPPQPAAPRPLPTWKQVGQWSGSGIKDTESFSIAGAEWRLTWATANETLPGAGVLQVYVYRGLDLVGVAANITGVKSDTSIMRTGPGPHYLKINSANVGWSVVVEDLK